jgi:hypothetical protein
VCPQQLGMIRGLTTAADAAAFLFTMQMLREDRCLTVIEFSERR